jgi:hypothetical protein
LSFDGLNTSGGGKVMGFSSTFRRPRLAISPMDSGNRVILLFDMAKNLSDDKRLTSSGILVIEFLLRSRISRFESWSI